jgi:hypothetical protein
LAAQAQPAPAKTHEQCILRSNIDGFRAADDRTVYLSAGVRDVYRLDLMSACPGITFKEDIGFEDRPASAWICSPLEATIVFRDVGVPQRCPVIGIHHLTPEEYAALPKRDRP